MYGQVGGGGGGRDWIGGTLVFRYDRVDIPTTSPTCTRTLQNLRQRGAWASADEGRWGEGWGEGGVMPRVGEVEHGVRGRGEVRDACFGRNCVEIPAAFRTN